MRTDGFEEQNHVGIERMIDDLEWNGELGFGVSSFPSLLFSP